MEQYPSLEFLSLFVKVVEAGSLTRVSRMHHIPKASLSRKLAQLEEFYGTQLLIRNTRNLQMTEIGRQVFNKAQALLTLAQETSAVVQATQEIPKGHLRISAGVEYGMHVISPLVQEYLKQYPHISIELDLTGRRVDLIYEGFDLGVRIGPMEDSTLSIRKVGSFRYGLFASPKLIKKHKMNRIQSLQDLPTLGFTRTSQRKTWTLVYQLEQQIIEIQPRLTSNNYDVLLQAACDGLGVVFMPTFLADDHVRHGSLQRIYPNWTSEEIPIQFIYPSQRFLTSKVRTFIDFAITRLVDSGNQDVTSRRPKR